jgi:23S rRNA pseudouridine2605 synthase
VKVAGVVTLHEYFDLAYGLDIGRGERSGRAIIREVRASDKYTWFELDITEGKNRQVRRMCEAIGHAVLKLVRVKIGRLSLEELAIGHFKILTPSEAQKALNK